MVNTKAYWIDEDHFIQVRTDLHKRKHEIIVDEGKYHGFTYNVSLVQGKGVIEFLERLKRLIPSNKYNPVFIPKKSTIVTANKKRGRKKKLKGKECEKCHSRMTRLYMHSNVLGLKQWTPIVWYCSHCDKIKDRIRL